MRFAGGRKAQLIPRINTIAIIDVMMVLLLYFIMAGSMAASETAIPSALKTERGKAAQSDLQSQVLTLEPAGQVGVVYRLGQREVKTRDELLILLKMLNRESGIVVKVSGRVSVSAAAAALQTCRDAGFSRVSYVPTK